MQAVTAGTNNLNVTLNGIVASISLALQNPSLNAGATGTTTLDVNALDGSGNVILGPVNVAATPNTPTVQSPVYGGRNDVERRFGYESDDRPHRIVQRLCVDLDDVHRDRNQWCNDPVRKRDADAHADCL